MRLPRPPRSCTTRAGCRSISLHNDTASAGESGVDCPNDGVAYWHFVLAPNNGTSSFFTVILNLRTGVDTTETLNFTGDQLVPNGSQTDNIFVAVPSGHSLGDLVALGSYATYTGNVPNEFNLSHTCDGTIATTTTTTTAAGGHHHRGLRGARQRPGLLHRRPRGPRRRPGR